MICWSLFWGRCGSVRRTSSSNPLQFSPSGDGGPESPPPPYLLQTLNISLLYLPPSLPSVSSTSLQADRPDTNTGLFCPPDPPLPLIYVSHFLLLRSDSGFPPTAVARPGTPLTSPGHSEGSGASVPPQVATGERTCPPTPGLKVSGTEEPWSESLGGVLIKAHL